MSDTQYIRKRRGRVLVQVAVPKGLREHFGKANVETYLRTSSEAEAERLRHAAAAEILESFDRAKRGGPIRPDELRVQAEAELRRAYESLAAESLDSHGRLPDLAREVGEDAVDLISASFETNRLLGKPTTKYTEDVLDRIGVEKTKESVAALSQAILKAHSAAIAMLERGIEPPPLKGQPVRRKRHGTALRVSEAGETCLTERQRVESEFQYSRSKGKGALPSG